MEPDARAETDPSHPSDPSDLDAVERLEASVHGRVQGVGFRWFVTRAARRLDLSGWVENRLDGTVTVVAEGQSAALDELARQLAVGPPGSFVERVDQRRAPASGRLGRFTLRSAGHRGD